MIRCLTRTLPLMLFALFLVACGDDGSQEEQDVVGDVPGDQISDGQDADPDLVVPTIPSFVEVTIEPTRAVYAPSQSVTPVARVYDVFGDEVEVDILWTIEPADGATDNGDGTWDLGAEGELTFTGCTDVLDQETVCGDRTIVVDAAPPVLDLFTPTPGQEINGETDAMISVTGQATDTHGDVRVFVNGVEVTLSADGMFAIEIDPQFGVNHLEVVATDGLRGRDTTIELDVLWAPTFLPPTAGPNPAFNLADALAIRIGQRFFDDGQPLMIVPEQPIVAQDLADVIDLLIQNVDLMSQIPDPVLSSPLLLRVTDVTVSDISVAIDVTDTGIELFIRLGAVELTTTGALDISGQMISLDGTITATLSAVAEIDIAKADRNANWDIDLRTLDVAIDDVSSNFVSPEANAVFEIAASLLRGTLEDLLVDDILAPVAQLVPDILLDLFQTLDTALADQSFPLDTGLGAPITLNLDASVDRLESQYRTSLDAWMAADISSESPISHPMSLGAASLTLQEMPPFLTVSRVQLGLRMMLLNGMLHVLWNSGLMELALDDLIGPGSTVSGKLPPVAHPPLEGEPWDLIISVGQLEASLALGSTPVVYGINLRAGVNITLVDSVIALEIQQVPDVIVWQVSEEGSDIFTIETVHQLVLETVWPQLFDAIGQSLEIPLPIPALGDLGGIAPALGNATIEVTMTRDVDVRSGFAVIDAGVDVVLP